MGTNQLITRGRGLREKLSSSASPDVPAFYATRLYNSPQPVLFLSQINTFRTLPNDFFWKLEDDININLRDIDCEEGTSIMFIGVLRF
jgi:hypothetical protein